MSLAGQIIASLQKTFSMEHILDEHLKVNNKDVLYRVSFSNEEYHFVSNDPDASPHSFSFKREHNEWIPIGQIEPRIQIQAIAQLEKYLLSQH
jgi:hypothetical protein